MLNRPAANHPAADTVFPETSIVSKEDELRQIQWFSKMDISPVPERYRYEFVLAMMRQNFERMVIGSKFGAVIIGLLIIVIDVLQIPQISPVLLSSGIIIHALLFVALCCGYFVGRRLIARGSTTPMWKFFAWGTIFRSLYTIIAYWLFYHLGTIQDGIASGYAVFVGLITAGLYADVYYTIVLAVLNAGVYTWVVLSTQTTLLTIVDDLFCGYAVLAIAAFSSSILYQSFRKEFAAAKEMEEERRKTQELNAQLAGANEEISRQMEILNDQARSIEIANTALQEQSLELERERDAADALLHNILPRPIAHRLKTGETTIAERFESVSVLFADIVGFTQIAASRTPSDVVVLLNRIFSAFDIFSEQYNLEKIKTIGDAYMIVGGVPKPRHDHCEAVARMALEMLSTIELLNQTLDIHLSVRIGVHTGAVVAGVIGQKKFSYDLWGDTVNIASRMESSGEGGKIHCSDAVYTLLKDKFAFEERGETAIKGKGTMQTWFLLGER
jgi:class 3 adenylate cyclase